LAASCDFLKKLFENGTSALSAQALSCEFVPFALELLKSELNLIEFEPGVFSCPKYPTK
jgi:hypothetical protein